MNLPAGLTLTGACDPEPIGARYFSLGCGGTLTNGGAGAVLVVAVQADLADNVLDAREAILAPGGTMALPAPGGGQVWLVAAEPMAAVRRRAEWRLWGGYAVDFLAGAGAGSIAALLWVWSAGAIRRHRGR